MSTQTLQASRKGSRVMSAALVLLIYSFLLWLPVLLKLIGLLAWTWLGAFAPLIINWTVLLIAGVAYVLVGPEPTH